eukprot:TRINITY_DN3174_c0_g1_i3.p1 TRINITY_DN3174_c0_g1~~TRINITY_DN3174_c0_g1_i3.p1  ORF type:complete len:190 (-),score=90.75 TRINITY_DN3174_c0_g1_i3:93-578(-)
MTKEQYEEVMKAYKKAATKDGRITRQAFVEMHQGQMPTARAEQMFDSFDKDKSGSIDVREYLSLMGVSQSGTPEQKLAASFDLFDKNGDGHLSKEEVKTLFTMTAKQKKGTLDAKTLAMIDKTVTVVFEKVDKDKSGNIDRKEFLEGFSAQPELCGFFKQY